jgi:hypothetical protein
VIIRPACPKSFTRIPNAVLNDTRLSIEARFLIVYLLSKPPTWNLRPVPLARALSSEDTRVGRKRLNGMIREAIDAGYIARSTEQTHLRNGSWGSYEYIVGMPDDVQTVVTKSGEKFLPQHPAAPAPEGRAPKGTVNHKVLSQKSQIDNNPPLAHHSPGESWLHCEGEYRDMGQRALAQGCRFVWEGSRPFKQWATYRRACGHNLPPPVDTVVINGARRRGAWFPSLYPPDKAQCWRMTKRGGAAHSEAIDLIKRSKGCSENEAEAILDSLPDAPLGSTGLPDDRRMR